LVIPGCEPASLFSQSFDQGPVFTVIEENDFQFDTDRHYTQGMKLAYFQADGDLPRWTSEFFSSIPALGFTPRADKFGYEAGQSIYTPADTSSKQAVPDDRPYAGWLYAGLILQRRGPTLDEQLTMESFQLDLGIIGPQSLAENAQKWFHKLGPSDTPKGWKHQLETEPGLALKYLRSWRLSPWHQDRRFFDLIPQAGACLGNVDTSAQLGATLRLGWNLPDDFGVKTIDSLTTPDGGWSPTHTNRQWGFYVFSGLEGSAVLYNAFLDGNLFRESHNVTKEPFVAEWTSGIVCMLRRVEVGYTCVYRTREFVQQPHRDRFGSVFFKYKF
jgi:hypothetical protein